MRPTAGRSRGWRCSFFVVILQTDRPTGLALLLFSFDRVLEFQDREVEFKGGFGVTGLQFLVINVGHDFATPLHKCFLHRIILDNGECFDRPGQLSDFCESFDDRKSCLWIVASI